MPAKSKKSGVAPANLPRPQPSNNTPQEVAKSSNPTKPLEQAESNPKLARGQTSSSISSSTVIGRANSDMQERARETAELTGAQTVNRKKQKRREKEAAKRAAEQHLSNGFSVPGHHPHNGHTSSYPHPGRGPQKGYFTEEADYVDHDFADEAVEVEDAFYSGAEDPVYAQEHLIQNGYSHMGQALDGGTIGKKKKKSKKDTSLHDLQQKHAGDSSTSLSRSSAAPSRSQLPPPAPLSNAALRSAHKISRDRIWNTSTQAERENIKQFWLELGEEERRSLVKVEKEAVLRKMKEQQKHSCSCTVCGRKRTAIEEELEVLYDAYYEELEQFANHNTDPTMMAPPRTYNQLRGPSQTTPGQYPSRGRVHEIGEDEEELDEEEEYEDDDEAYSDEEVEELPRGPPDFFTFGNSLTVKDGILTVADDLLKNDGKHFIDMMEQLAERRMQREEETHYPSAALAHPNIHQGHNHPPLDEDDDDYDDEDDEDYDSQEEDEYEGDEMDSMTEEQRMEEGRRMFQIFAARMFEQRVLTAYREKVARERQRKLIEELDEESRLDTQREAKKAKEAAKKKEKKKLQKQAKEEEKAKRDAEKSAQEAEARALEEKKLEEQRQRKEEQRRKRDAEKKAAEEDRLRKEVERQRKAQEERERQAEVERKQKEAKEREKKKRDEARKKERELREAKEKDVRERKAREDQERKAKEEQTRKEREAATKAEKETRDRARHEQTTRRPPIAVPPGLHPTHHSAMQSPHFQVATPIIPPKVPTPGRHRQASQQGGLHSHGSSPRSQQANTDNSHSSASPAGIAVPHTPGPSHPPMKTPVQPPILHHPQPSAPLSPLNNQGRTGHPPYGFHNMSGLGMNGPPPSVSGMMPGMMPGMPMYQGPPMGGQHRNFGLPNGMPYPPGINGSRQFPPSQHMPFHNQPTMPIPISAPQVQPPKSTTHSQQNPSSYSEINTQPVPISRPAPIGRPASTTPDKYKEKRKSANVDIDNLATQLGSKALLDDSDIPLTSNSESIPIPIAAGPPGHNRAPFGFPDTKHDSFALGGQNWSGFTPNLPGSANWGAPMPSTKQGGGWLSANQPANNAFGIIGVGMHNMPRPHASRPVAIRLMLAQACKQLSSTPGSSPDGYHPVQTVLRQVEQLTSTHEPAVSLNEMLEICDTEGNGQNGGGSFDVRHDGTRGQIVKFEADGDVIGRVAVGDIGSPVVGHSQPSSFGGIGQAIGAPGKSF